MNERKKGIGKRNQKNEKKKEKRGKIKTKTNKKQVDC